MGKILERDLCLKKLGSDRYRKERQGRSGYGVDLGRSGIIIEDGRVARDQLRGIGGPKRLLPEIFTISKV